MPYHSLKRSWRKPRKQFTLKIVQYLLWRMMTSGNAVGLKCSIFLSHHQYRFKHTPLFQSCNIKKQLHSVGPNQLDFKIGSGRTQNTYVLKYSDCRQVQKSNMPLILSKSVICYLGYQIGVLTTEPEILSASPFLKWNCLFFFFLTRTCLLFPLSSSTSRLTNSELFSSHNCSAELLFNESYSIALDSHQCVFPQSASTVNKFLEWTTVQAHTYLTAGSNYQVSQTTGGGPLTKEAGHFWLWKSWTAVTRPSFDQAS